MTFILAGRNSSFKFGKHLFFLQKRYYNSNVEFYKNTGEQNASPYVPLQEGHFAVAQV